VPRKRQTYIWEQRICAAARDFAREITKSWLSPTASVRQARDFAREIPKSGLSPTASGDFGATPLTFAHQRAGLLAGDRASAVPLT